MIESPLLDRIINEKMAEASAASAQKSILSVLKVRLGPVPEDISAAVRAVKDELRP